MSSRSPSSMKADEVDHVEPVAVVDEDVLAAIAAGDDVVNRVRILYPPGPGHGVTIVNQISIVKHQLINSRPDPLLPFWF